ncbi:MAG TPA: ATP-binding protein, partial [Isosphaeraceae bacterium]|nr:ATP-binding protein [Isosphaeraceae bacterium]
FGSNFRSFKNEFELSMVAADLKRKEDRDRGVIELPITGMIEPLKLLRTVAIFGPNASGKSTVLVAGRALRWLATDSSARSEPDATIQTYQPFALDDESRTSPVELGCDVVCKELLLRYEIRFDAKTIQGETLRILDDRREVKLIDRQPSGEVRGKLVTQSKANQLYVKEMQPNVAVLSKLAQHGPHSGKESVQPYYRAIRNALRYADYSNASEMYRVGRAAERFADDAEYREWIMRELIRAADVGIFDVQTRRESFEIPDFFREGLAKITEGMAKMDAEVKLPDKRVVVSFVHEGSSIRPIDFSDESSGTRKLFNIAGDWWALAHNPVTLFADELSASLHPRLLDCLIRAVNDAPKSRVQSQLIFATHDTGLLEGQDGQPPALRRDQVYFTKKNAKGVTELYSLTEFKEGARPVHNMRKRYRSGVYGAIPTLDKFSL